MRALGFIGYAGSDNVDALKDIISHHPINPLPTIPVGHIILPPITVDQHAVSCVLKSSPRGTSSGGSSLRVQRLLDINNNSLCLCLFI